MSNIKIKIDTLNHVLDVCSIRVKYVSIKTDTPNRVSDTYPKRYMKVLASDTNFLG